MNENIDYDKEAIKYITCNIREQIESFRWTTSIRLEGRPPCIESDFVEWEKKHNRKLPKDIRDFYSVTNGIQLSWNAYFAITNNIRNIQSEVDSDSESWRPLKCTNNDIEYDEKIKARLDEKLVGTIDILPCQSLNIAPQEELSGLHQYILFKKSMETIPIEDACAFILEHTSDSGVVYLCYGFDFDRAINDDLQDNRTQQPHISINLSFDEAKDKEETGLWSIWLKTKAKKWYPLSSSFSSYFRLAIVHLGIRGWQNAFTTEGFDEYTTLCMRRFAPERYVLDLSFSVG